MKRNETGLGKSNDKGKAVRDEIRAAELQYDMHRTKGENRGYATHHNGTDVPHDGWAGWLEREISTHDEQQDEALHTRPSPNWPDNLLDAISEQGRQAAARHAEASEPVKIDQDWRAKVDAACDEIDDQRRHDAIVDIAVAIDEVTRTGRGFPPANEVAELDGPDHAESLDGIDQSEPATQPSEPLVEQPDIHSEPTHVGTIDERFEDGDGL